jgi:hypothetical protein
LLCVLHHVDKALLILQYLPKQLEGSIHFVGGMSNFIRHGWIENLADLEGFLVLDEVEHA